MSRLKPIPVLTNLVTNAYQAMPKGGCLTIRASLETKTGGQGSKKVSPNLQEQESGGEGNKETRRQGDRGTGELPLTPPPPFSPQLRLTITDTGDGISPENMQKLFEPLFTTKTKGIGLGLVVSKNLVEANRGTIEVESKENEGSTFTVSLPLADND